MLKSKNAFLSIKSNILEPGGARNFSLEKLEGNSHFFKSRFRNDLWFLRVKMAGDAPPRLRGTFHNHLVEPFAQNK